MTTQEPMTESAGISLAFALINPSHDDVDIAAEIAEHRALATPDEFVAIATEALRTMTELIGTLVALADRAGLPAREVLSDICATAEVIANG